MKEYTVKLTESQLRLISRSLDLGSRLNIGQWQEILDWLPLKPTKEMSEEERGEFYNTYHNCKSIIGNYLAPLMVNEVTGWGSSLGIHSTEVEEDARIAYDMHQVIRRHLSYEHAIEQGWVQDDKERDWKNMMGVNYDEVHQTSPSVPLIELSVNDGSVQNTSHKNDNQD